MNTREVEAKARLLFDEYGPDAIALAERRAEAFGRRGASQAEGWRAVRRRVDELARQEIAAEAAEVEGEILRAGRGTLLGRFAAQVFGSASRPA